MDGYGGYPQGPPTQYPPTPTVQQDYGQGILPRPPSRTNSQPPPGKYKIFFSLLAANFLLFANMKCHKLT